MPVTCPRCTAFLPPFPGVDDYVLIEIAELMRANLIEAIKRVRELSGAGLKEAKDYVDCPHRVLPVRDGSCPSCRRAMPPLPEFDAAIAAAFHAGQSGRVATLMVSRFAWPLDRAAAFADCPHRVAPVGSPGATPLNLGSTCPACRAMLPPLPAMAADQLELVASLLRDGRKIEAIKEVRAATRLGLKEAKDYVDCPHRLPS